MNKDNNISAGPAKKQTIEEYLANDEKKDLLRFLTAGSVDDGKSTLIGRLLFDSKKIYEDQLDALERDSKRVGNAGEHIDYALLLDGLKAEREQGITIDVAYRYFSTNRRKFIIADTPGHEQYTRNMITGGSTANLAIILVDSRTGVITQTRRHTYLVSLLGIKHVVLAVNKMDLVGYSQERFDEICTDYIAFISKLGIPDVQCFPLSALEGDNVVSKSDNTPWYSGPALLDFLETVHVGNDQNFTDFRFPIQYVLRPDRDFRGFSGKVASGVVRTGDEVVALPSGKRTHVKRIVTYDGDQECAFPPQSVTLTLEDEIDVSRGEMLVHPTNLPTISRSFEAMLVWMDEEDMDVNKQFFIKQTTNTSRARIDGIKYKVDVNTMEQSKVSLLKLNEIGKVVITASKNLFFDKYSDNKSCGSFILIDPITNNTSAVGMITERVDTSDLYSTITEDDRKKMLAGESLVGEQQWKDRINQEGQVYWVAGHDKKERRELVYTLERRLYDIGKFVCRLSLDSLGLGSMSQGDLAKVAHQLSKNGLVVVCSGEGLDAAFSLPGFVNIRIKGDGEDAHGKEGNEIVISPKEMAQAIEDLISKT